MLDSLVPLVAGIHNYKWIFHSIITQFPVIVLMALCTAHIVWLFDEGPSLRKQMTWTVCE